MNNNLILECLRELLLDPEGKNMPMRKLLIELIDKELNPINKEEPCCEMPEEITRE